MKHYLVLIFTLAPYLFIQGYNPEHLNQLIKTKICHKCDLTKAPLQGYILNKADVEGSDFSGAQMSGTQFEHANFKDTILEGATLSSSLLNHADFTGTKARAALFVNTHLRYAKFIGADLSEANFTSSTPFKTDFDGAQFHDTRFDHADMLSAILRNTTGNIITDYRTNICCTIMSDGSISSLHGYKCGHQQTSGCKLPDSTHYADTNRQQTVYTGWQV